VAFIPPLALLASASAIVQELDAATLCNLSANVENKVTIASAGGIPPLMELLASTPAGVQEYAAAVLGNLSTNAKNKITIALACGMAPHIALRGSPSACRRLCAHFAIWASMYDVVSQISTLLLN
jgi:hypothetical protein